MKLIHLLVAGITLLQSSEILAQASLAAENIIDSVSVDVKTPDGSVEQQVFSLVRDAHNSDQWYYFPNQPRLSEQVINGKRMPELTFIRYTSSTNDGQLNSAGLLTFAITLGASPDALEEMKKKLAEYLQKSGKALGAARLSPIPLNSATASVYSPKTGNLLAEGGANSVVVPDTSGPTNASSKVVFALMLTDVGSDIYNQLLNGTGGIPVWVRYKFNGLTPPAGFRVTANWDRAYEHYSKDEKFRARASYYGLFSANYASDRQYIRDELLKSGDIVIESITGGDFTQEKLDSYLQPIVKRLNDTLLMDARPPQNIDPASAGTPPTEGYFGGVGYSVSVKDIKYVLKGKETWDFRFSSIVERGGVADGNVGLKGYPKQVRDSLVTSLKAGDWDKVYFSTPNTGGVDGADLRVQLKDEQKVVAEKYLKWSDRTGWINTQGSQPLNGFWVSLLGVEGFDRSKATWETYYTFSLGPYSVKSSASIPLEGNAGGLIAPVDLVRKISVGAGALTFDGLDSNQPLSVDVRLTDGVLEASKTFTRTNIGGVVGVTSDLEWIVPAQRGGEKTPISARLVFNFSSKQPCIVDISPREFDARFISNSIIIPAAKGSCY